MRLLAQSIVTNTPLRRIVLDVIIQERNQEEDMIGLARALAHSSSMKHFSLLGLHKQSQKVQQTFVEMLKHDYILESCSLVERTNIEREFDFYLALNRLGRGRLMANENAATRQDWVDVPLKSQRHLDCLFYFLSSNPGSILDEAKE